MAKKDFKFNIEEIIEVLSERENNDWAKVVSKITWNDGMPQIDIRNMNLANMDNNGTSGVLFGKGITLTDEEVENLIRALLKEGYLDDSEVLSIISSRNDVFKMDISNKKNKIRIKIKKVV